MKSLVVATAAAILFAQSTPMPTPSPTPAPTAGLPSATQVINDIVRAVTGGVTAAYGYNANQVHGRVTYFHRFDMQVELQLSKYRSVKLHPGTVINPRGATIREGQTIDAWGRADPDGTLEADTINIH